MEVFGPSRPGGYFRLRWTGLDGARADTTGGRDLDSAPARAAEIAGRLGRAAGPHASAALADLFGEYLSQGRSPHTGRVWRSSTRAQIEDNLGRALRGFEAVAAHDVDRDLLDLMRSQAGTPHMVRINTTALRAFLLWGYRRSPRVFSAGQVDLLPVRAAAPEPRLRGTPAPSRRQAPRRVGEAEKFIREEDAPSASQVAALSRTLGSRVGDWGRLAPELAASSGLRWGEQFQLRAADIHLAGCVESGGAHVHVDWTIDAGGAAAHAEGAACAPRATRRD